MPLEAAGKNAANDFMAANRLLFLSAHTVDAPGATGASEVVGGTYARIAVTWGASAAGVLTATGMPKTLQIPASVTVRSLGFWTALTGGTFVGVHNLADETYGTAGTLVINSLTYTY